MADDTHFYVACRRGYAFTSLKCRVQGKGGNSNETTQVHCRGVLVANGGRGICVPDFYHCSLCKSPAWSRHIPSLLVAVEDSTHSALTLPGSRSAY
jgi:hypothetical protein